MQTAADRLKHELNDLLRQLRTDLERIEILSLALDAFNAPVPDYEAGFRHFAPLERELNRFELER
jgi:hypothetical protein